MNSQWKEGKPRGGIEWTHAFGDKTGYTWSPITGCMHGCEWEIDGKIAVCYAKSQAESARLGKAYPNKFAHHYWHPDRLNQPAKVKTPAGVFICSMADLMGNNVPDEHIEAVLEVTRTVNYHNYMILTKNAPRLLKWKDRIPENVWVGASMPADWMYDKRLDRNQQDRMLHKTLDVLGQINVPVRWLSAEPLSWNIGKIIKEHPGAINWAVVGAASDGPKYFPPKDVDLLSTLVALRDIKSRIFFKGNLSSSPIIKKLNVWLEEFPLYTNPAALKLASDSMTHEDWQQSLGGIFDSIISRSDKDGE